MALSVIRHIVPVRSRRLRLVTSSAPDDSDAPPQYLTEQDRGLHDRLLAGLGPHAGDNELSELTGNPYSIEQPPSFLAVRTGDAVRSRSSSGLSNARWTDHDGARLTWFAAGSAPAAFAGVTVDFAGLGGAESNAQRCAVAVRYLRMWLDS